MVRKLRDFITAYLLSCESSENACGKVSERYPRSSGGEARSTPGAIPNPSGEASSAPGPPEHPKESRRNAHDGNATHDVQTKTEDGTFNSMMQKM
jgi:hypothetical protein